MSGPLLSITHSARTDIAASVTSARGGLAGSGEPVEHLGGPDHRDVRCFAGPQDLS